MSIVKHLIDHAKMGFPYTDENGNLVTNGIIPRTGTLVELLAETGTGEGEVATASNVDVVVVYKGGVPVVYPRNQAVTAVFDVLATPLTPAETRYSLTVSSDPLGVISGGNFVIPTWLPSSRVLVPRISGYFLSLASLTDANTNITIQLKRYVSGAWINVGDPFVLTCDATGFVNEYLPQRVLPEFTRATTSQLGIFISHDQTNAFITICKLTLELLN